MDAVAAKKTGSPVTVEPNGGFVDPALDPNVLVSVVIPLKNESGTLVELFERVRDVFNSLNRKFEIIFVDDGSTDASFRVLTELYNSNPNTVRVVSLRSNKGKAAALSAGFDIAEGGIVVTMDADLQDDPAEIPRFLEALADGADMVSGWKQQRHDPWYRVGASRFFNWVVSVAAGLRLHDYNCGFKAYRREVVDEITIYGELHRYIPFIANSRGFRVTEIVVKHHPRKSGRSRYDWQRYFRGFFDLFTVVMITRFGRKPLHVFGSIGTLLFLIGLVINIRLSWAWMHGHPIGDRPLLILGVLLMVVGIQTFTSGLLGEMINSLRPPDSGDRPIRKILK
jgi:glycosyltransferase involved in cell wall biosynthesis